MSTLRRHGLEVLARGLAAVLLLALGGGCSGGDSSTDFGDNDPGIVVALGDSITVGAHDMGTEICDESRGNELGFCPRLQGLSGKTVVNEGNCGEDSYGGVERIEGVLQRWRPGVILIDYSPNDLGHSTDAVISNLRTMIQVSRTNNTVPILGTLVPAVGRHQGWELFIERLNLKILELCDTEGVQCADHYRAFTSDPRFIADPYVLLAEDGLHPNAEVYTVMAATWHDPLMRLY